MVIHGLTGFERQSSFFSFPVEHVFPHMCQLGTAGDVVALLSASR